jgi:hypothetical protein
VRLEGLGQLKKIHLIGTRSRDLLFTIASNTNWNRRGKIQKENRPKAGLYGRIVGRGKEEPGAEIIQVTKSLRSKEIILRPSTSSLLITVISIHKEGDVLSKCVI